MTATDSGRPGEDDATTDDASRGYLVAALQVYVDTKKRYAFLCANESEGAVVAGRVGRVDCEGSQISYTLWASSRAENGQKYATAIKTVLRERFSKDHEARREGPTIDHHLRCRKSARSIRGTLRADARARILLASSLGRRRH